LLITIELKKLGLDVTKAFTSSSTISKIAGGWDFAPDPNGGAHCALQTSSCFQGKTIGGRKKDEEERGGHEK
jgi:hypothetical protein